ncbi:hypothetical protein GQ55_9G405800 [Panicum hallii var. hallii]|uniref:Uncharacterized protein n=1 Tax=Panicum hallii var. hallii TaxID=1504633 RepID=A0A2T7CA31_9POAL|nr:hypothetical protein GQ55_9G405800 [Panicum hallii var. hallii]
MPLPAEPRADAAEQQVDPVQRGGEGGHEGRHGMPVEHLPQPPPHARDRSTCRRRHHLLYARVRSTSHNSSASPQTEASQNSGASTTDRDSTADRRWRTRVGSPSRRLPQRRSPRSAPSKIPRMVQARCAAASTPSSGAPPPRTAASPISRLARSAPTSSAAPPRRELRADQASGVHPHAGHFRGPPAQHGRSTPGTLEVGPRGLFAPMPLPSQAPWRISLQSSMSLPPIAPSSPHPLKMIDWQRRLRQATGACAVPAHELLRPLHQALRFQPVSLSYCSGVARNCILLLD